MKSVGKKKATEVNIQELSEEKEAYKVPEGLESRDDKHKYITSFVDKIDIKKDFEKVLFVAEYALNNKFYKEFVQVVGKFLDIAGSEALMETHKFLNKFLYSSKLSFLKKTPKEDLLDISSLYVKIALRYYLESSYLEAFQALDDGSEVINFTKTFPERRYTVVYFSLLSMLFLSGNMIFSFLNALARLVMLNTTIKASVPAGEFYSIISTCFRILSFKNEECLFQRFFGCLPMLSLTEMKKILNKGISYTHYDKSVDEEIDRSEILLDLSLDNKWNLVLDEKHLPFSTEDTGPLSFLETNNIEFFIQENRIILDGYRYKSMTRRVFSLKEKFSKADSGLTKKTEDLRKKAFARLQGRQGKHAKREDQKEEKNSTVETKKDYFTKKYNLFRLYAREAQSSGLEASKDHEERKRTYKIDFEKHRKREAEIVECFMKIREPVLSAVKALDEKVEAVLREKRQREIRDAKKEEVQIEEGSWRESSVASRRGLEKRVQREEVLVPELSAGGNRTGLPGERMNSYVPPIHSYISRISLSSEKDKKENSFESFSGRSPTGSFSGKENSQIYIPPVYVPSASKSDEELEKASDPARPNTDSGSPGKKEKKDEGGSWRK